MPVYALAVSGSNEEAWEQVSGDQSVTRVVLLADPLNINRLLKLHFVVFGAGMLYCVSAYGQKSAHLI